MRLGRLGVGFVGSGAIARSHIRSFVGVRDADVLGVWSPTAEHAASAAALARELGVGEARAFDSIEAMVRAPEIDALWLCGPNHRRLDNVEEIAAAMSGGAALTGVACEKPLARNLREARRVRELVRDAGLLDGYLENQVFMPTVTRGRELLWTRGAALGRPYLARAAEEHGGPHSTWFWRGDLQGGGVLNDMACHSVEVARYLLTRPGDPRESLTPRKVSAQIACLKWQRPRYAERLRHLPGPSPDYAAAPAEDYARVLVEYADADGTPLIVEATTSWSYVGPGLRLGVELLGPEYSMKIDTQDSALKLFLGRETAAGAGEELLEKQNADTGWMPVLADEVAAYGYEAQSRHMVRAFLAGERPAENFDDGVAVTELLMSAYLSAEEERSVAFDADSLVEFVPAVARGEWNPAR